MTYRNIRVGLFGFGCVGKGLHDVLHATPGIKAEIVKIAVKNKNKKRAIDPRYFVFEPQEILADDDINTVVELIDDHHVAYEIGKQALLNGKNLITANKRMLAHHLNELSTIAAERDLSFLYEGAACGSIPIIRNLEEYYDNDLLSGLSGIFNGSSNFILSKMSQEGMGYESALRLAQEEGFAESDPTLDVNGYDALFKTVILVAHSFGVFIHPDQIQRLGIQNLQRIDLEFAGKHKLKIKPICTIKKKGSGSFTATVMPGFIKSDNYLYSVENEYNAVSIEAAFSDRQLLIGKGAGGHPTGSAVLSDISACSYGYRYEYKKMKQGLVPSYSLEEDLQVYVRSPRKIPQDLRSALSISRSPKNTSGETLIGRIHRNLLKEKSKEWEEDSIFIATFPE